MADPTTKSTVVVGLLNCSIHSFRPLDVGSNSTPRLPGERSLGLYTDANLYFPYKTLTTNLGKHSPDLYVAIGDQFYEHRPTSTDTSAAPTLDFLYKYYLWLWAFRELTRNRPTVVLVDDHDVYQGNLWGHAGAAAPAGNANLGGYARDPGWVNLVQRVQCGHNPDPFDPTPVLQGISVYYGMFRYGGVSFALLEDRKWKSGDADGRDASGNPYPDAASQLLGARQHTFVQAWTSAHPGLPKVCISQTLFGCLQTDTVAGRRGGLRLQRVPGLPPSHGGHPPQAGQGAGRLRRPAPTERGPARHQRLPRRTGAVRGSGHGHGVAALVRAVRHPAQRDRHCPTPGTGPTASATSCRCWPSRTRR